MGKPLNPRPMRIEDFSGGITDYFIGGNPSRYEIGDNYLINENKDLVTRPGSLLHNATFPSNPDGNVRYNSIQENDGQIFVHSTKDLHYVDGAFNTLLGPSTNSIFNPTSTSAHQSSFAKWNKHLFSANDNYSDIMKVYKDENSVWQLRNIGLPEIRLYSSITSANDVKAKYNAHIADAAQHTTAPDATNIVTAANATDFDTLVVLIDDIIAMYQLHDDDAELGAGWAYHAAQEAADHSLSSLISPITIFQCATRLEDIILKINAHDNDGTAHGVAGSHQIVDDPNPTVSIGAPSTDNYIYGMHYIHEYKIGDVLFEVKGPTYLVEGSLSSDPAVSNNTLADIGNVVNGTTQNYDTTNIKIEIYRTLNNGSILYYHSTINNGTTTFVDSLADAAISNNRVIYTEGGLFDNDPPPRAKHLAVINDVLITGNVKEGAVVYPNRLRFSNRFNPASSPESFFLDFEEDITGLGRISIYPIVFSEDKCYRLEGLYDPLGRGGYAKREISTKIGCIAESSIVQTKEGIYFASDDGFYFTDGFRVRRISKAINKRYALLINKDKMTGAFDSDNNIVLWGVDASGAAGDNDTVYAADLNYPISDGDYPFTTWSGGNDPSNFSVTALAFENDEILRADRRGYLLKHSDAELADPKIDTALTPSTWYTATIIYDYRSVANDFDASQVRKWVSKMVVNADNISSMSLDIKSNNDNSGVFKDLKPVIDKGNFEWGDPTIIWGTDDMRWNFYPTISAWRRFPNRGLRCQYKQVRFTNAYTTIDNSVAAGAADITAATKIITLLSFPTSTWLDDAAGYFISFDYDNYANEYLILGVTGADITVQDTSGILTDQTSVAWRIKGYRKREIFNLLNYTLIFDYITDTMSSFTKDA